MRVGYLQEAGGISMALGDTVGGTMGSWKLCSKLGGTAMGWVAVGGALWGIMALRRPRDTVGGTTGQ